VTLEEDLQRRDLTVNAMAESETVSSSILTADRRISRRACCAHVSEAFVEDPCASCGRALRGALCRAGFRVAD